VELAAGEFETVARRFRDDLREQVSTGQIEAIWLGYTAVGGSFQGIDGTEEIVQAGYDGVDLTLAFDRGTHGMRVLSDDQAEYAVVSAVVNDEYRPPEYADSDAFRVEETTVETEDCLMDAAVTVPTDTDADAVPGVVLVHGSDPVGAADKDLSTVGSKPFRDLAEGLASRGVAVLRYDRRTHACPGTLEPETHTLDNVTVDDPLVAIEHLRGVDGVDPDRITVAGISLGGMAVPRIAQRDGNLAGGVAMAAPAREFHGIFIEQFEHLATVGEYEREAMVDVYERWSERIDRIRQGDYEPGDIVLDYPGALWDSVGEYDQVGTARDVDAPLLFLQGDRDYQVSVEKDFQRWQTELDGRPDTSFELYDGLNHLFQYGEGPSVRAEYNLYNPVDRAVVEDVAAWVTGL